MMASSLSVARFCGQSAAPFARTASSSAAAGAQNADGVNVRGSNAGRELVCRGNMWGRKIQYAPVEAFPCRGSKVKASPISMGWTQMPGGLKTISSGDEKTVVGTDTANNVYLFDGTEWSQATGKMAQVSAGFSGMWAVDRQNQLYQWDEAAPEFVEVTPMPGSGKIAHVASGQDVYVIDTKRQIFKYQGEGKWIQLDGLLDAIDTNDYGDLWGIQLGELKKVYRRFSGRWVYVPGPEGRDSVKQISTGLCGVWAVDAKGSIFRWVMNTSETGAWFKEEGSLSAISAGYPTVWGLDKNGKVYRYTV
ncbi:hypothetical protein KFL_003060060 [Klebsormidium nitens]|uniref:Uncharacterized protein n=1 Tax=Klebsormidium nitens TaxID=105231 RepID=A0A1Y1IDB7_KLENI|nr:hypothetical protein KFL_003060060 [Klebsormidium nitens]|eukprot:GAQ86707.1 hypothetical protein KFL_003060060 [Klebsormidium nitens]